MISDVIFPTPLPPSNPDDPCHGVKCVAGGYCQVDNSGHAKCQCELYCSPPPRYEPVCGSDFEFYESECLMQQHSCNIQVQLYLKPVESCAGESIYSSISSLIEIFRKSTMNFTVKLVTSEFYN